MLPTCDVTEFFTTLVRTALDRSIFHGRQCRVTKKGEISLTFWKKCFCDKKWILWKREIMFYSNPFYNETIRQRHPHQSQVTLDQRFSICVANYQFYWLLCIPILASKVVFLNQCFLTSIPKFAVNFIQACLTMLKFPKKYL